MSDFLAGPSLASRATRGALVMSAGGGVEQLARLARQLVMVRLLAPDDFGVMAILVATNGAFESLTEVGVRQAVIQNPRGAERAFLNSVWWLSWFRALMLYAFGTFLAPPLAGFYGSPELTPYLRYVFLWVLFHGTISPRAFLALKHMRYGGWVAINQGAALIGVATSLVTVAFHPGIMALMTGFVAEAAAQTVLSYLLYPFAPDLTFDRGLFGQLTRYARGMAGAPMLTFIFVRSDVIVLGKLVALEVLGAYDWVGRFAKLPIQAASKMAAQLLLPAFSTIQHNHARLNRAVVRITAIILGLGATAMLFALLFGHDFIMLAAGAKHGERYAAFSLVMALSAGSAVLRLLSVPIAQVFFALARPDVHRRFAFVRAAVLAAMIYPAARWFGAVGAAWAVLAASVLAGIYHFAALSGLTGLSLRRLAGETAAGLFLAAPVALVWALTHAWTAGRPLWSVAAGLAGCALSLAAAAALWIRRAQAA